MVVTRMRIEIIFRDMIFFHLQDCTFVDANDTEAVVDNLLVRILNIYEQKFLVDRPAMRPMTVIQNWGNLVVNYNKQ